MNTYMYPAGLAISVTVPSRAVSTNEYGIKFNRAPLNTTLRQAQQKSGFRYAHTCIYAHVFMYSCIHVFMYSCIHVFMYSCIHVFIYSYIHVFSLPMCVRMCECVYASTYACV
jgi:hypothetical protein